MYYLCGVVLTQKINMEKIIMPKEGEKCCDQCTRQSVTTESVFSNYDKVEITPSTVITSELLIRLCDVYHEELRQGSDRRYLPPIRIRYVEDNGKFGYAWFGDFFFFADDLYVWKHDKVYAQDHNCDVVIGEFGDECTERGYACRFLYAGADTNFKDSRGEHIFVGDVLEIDDAGLKTELALGYIANGEDGNMVYCFVLDNHFLSLEDCLSRNDRKVTRVGTSYFQLDWNFEMEDMNNKIFEFNNWHDTQEDHEEKVLMSRYTPCFYKEIWKYRGFEILEIEYDWR